MQRLVLGCLVFLVAPCLAAAAPPTVPLIEGESIKITLKEFSVVPKFGAPEIKRIQRISTKEGDRIQLSLGDVIIEADEIILNCPNSTGTNTWKIEVAKEPGLMNIQSWCSQEKDE